MRAARWRWPRTDLACAQSAPFRSGSSFHPEAMFNSQSSHWPRHKLVANVAVHEEGHSKECTKGQSQNYNISRTVGPSSLNCVTLWRGAAGEQWRSQRYLFALEAAAALLLVFVNPLSELALHLSHVKHLVLVFRDHGHELALPGRQVRVSVPACCARRCSRALCRRKALCNHANVYCAKRLLRQSHSRRPL